MQSVLRLSFGACLWVVFLLMPLSLHAQDEVDYVSDNDGARTTGAVWSEVGFTKVLPYDLSLGLDAGFRTDDWFNEASRADIGLGLSWKPNKHWKVSVGYTFIMKHYRSETERKTVQENGEKYKYSILDAAGAEVSEMDPEPTSLNGFPVYTTDGQPFDGTNAFLTDEGEYYWYKGYNYSEKTKNYVRVTDDYWRPKHRLSVDASYTTNRFWSGFRVSVRGRYQVTFVPEKEVNRTRTKTTDKTTWRYRSPYYDYNDDGDMFIDGYGQNPEHWTRENHTHDNPEYEQTTEVEYSTKAKKRKTLHTLRSRLTIEYDRKGWDWTPYIYVEAFNDLASRMNLDKIRASIGVEYAVAKNHKLGIGYIFNHEDDDDGNENIHAINVGYKFKF